MAGTVTASVQGLTAVARALLRGVGANEATAQAVAENLVLANLKGHDSHGVGYLPNYVSSARDGRVNVDGQVVVETDNGAATVVLDAQRCFGQTAGLQAVQLAVERAKHFGVAAVALKNSHHLGRIGHWAELCTQQGLCSIHLTNVSGHQGLVAPFGGYDARLGTNPVTLGFPYRPFDVIVDFATSKVALGKVREALSAGAPAPDQAVMDAAGKLTQDPAAMFAEPKGALLPFGAHKGAALAAACELFTSALFGGFTMAPAAPGGAANPNDGTILNSMLTIAIDPASFAQAGFESLAIADAIAAYLRDAPGPGDGCNGPGPVRLPGEVESETFALRSQRGIPIPRAVATTLDGLCDDLGTRALAPAAGSWFSTA